MNLVSLVGRPNTGKSALFNHIAKKRVAIVFDQPGVTRDRVMREVALKDRRVMLADTGGIAFDRAVTREGLAALKPPPLRREVRVIGAVRYTFDCYNASPQSMRESLRTLDELPCQGKKIAVLADMLDADVTEWTQLKTGVKDALSKYLYQKTKRKPMILPVIMNV